MQVDDDAAGDEIKKAYRALAKECHPDYMGDRGHNICILLNEAYETLMDEGARAAYNAQLETALADEDDGYTGGCGVTWGGQGWQAAVLHGHHQQELLSHDAMLCAVRLPPVETPA
jgi:DnaJ-class molecular chaperone